MKVPNLDDAQESKEAFYRQSITAFKTSYCCLFSLCAGSCVWVLPYSPWSMHSLLLKHWQLLMEKVIEIFVHAHNPKSNMKKGTKKSTKVWKRTHILLKLKEKLPSLPFFRDNVSLHSSQEGPSSQSVSNSCGKRQLGVLLLPRDGMPVIVGYLYKKVKLHFNHYIVLLTFLAPKEGHLSIPVWQGGRQLNNQPPLLHKSPLELL